MPHYILHTSLILKVFKSPKTSICSSVQFSRYELIIFNNSNSFEFAAQLQNHNLYTSHSLYLHQTNAYTDFSQLYFSVFQTHYFRTEFLFKYLFSTKYYRWSYSPRFRTSMMVIKHRRKVEFQPVNVHLIQLFRLCIIVRFYLLSAARVSQSSWILKHSISDLLSLSHFF